MGSGIVSLIPLRGKVSREMMDALTAIHSKIDGIASTVKDHSNQMNQAASASDLQAHAVQVEQAVAIVPASLALSSGGAAVLNPTTPQTIQGTNPGAVLIIQAPAGATQPALTIEDQNGVVIASFGLAIVLADAVQFGAVVTSFNGLPTVGFGLPAIQVLQTSTPTTPVGATSIYAAAPVGLYRIDLYFVVTSAGVGGAAITLNLSYTDAQGARTDS